MWLCELLSSGHDRKCNFNTFLRQKRPAKRPQIPRKRPQIPANARKSGKVVIHVVLVADLPVHMEVRAQAVMG